MRLEFLVSTPLANHDSLKHLLYQGYLLTFRTDILTQLVLKEQ